MQYKNKFGVAISSSMNPNELSATVSGLILGMSSLIIYIAHTMGLNIGTQEMSLIASQGGAVVAGLWFFYGLIRKVVVWFGARRMPNDL